MEKPSAQHKIVKEIIQEMEAYDSYMVTKKDLEEAVLTNITL